MERIQSALAKARAAREGQGSAPSTTRSRKPSDRTTVPQNKHDAWNGIRQLTIDPKRLRGRRVVAFESGLHSTEFDRLRTRILQRMRAEGWSRLAVVSPTAQNGKSTVAANLAFSIARQSHLTTMLLETDLRRPSLSSLLDLPENLDFSRALAEEAPFSDHAVRLRPNLIVAPSHPVRIDAAEFLQSPKVISALDGVIEAYAPSVTLFDMSPMVGSDDAIGFLSNVHCALIVASAGTTTIDDLDRCEREIAERTSVLGTVLNKCRFEQHRDDYGY